MIYRSIFNRDVVWTESVPSEQVDDMLDLLRDFRDIICLLYSDMYTRSPSLVVSLHVRTWMFQRRCLRVLPTAPALYSLPFHQLCCHLPSLSRDYFLVDLTTESFEALWKNLRGVENGSNHRGDMPRRCLLAMYYKQVIADRIGSRSPRHQAISAGYRKAAASLVTRFVVPPTLSQEDGAFRDDFLWLIWGLADFHLDTWYRVEVDNSVTFLFGDYAAAGMPLGSSSPGAPGLLGNLRWPQPYDLLFVLEPAHHGSAR